VDQYVHNRNTVYVVRDDELSLNHTKSRGLLYWMSKEKLADNTTFVTPFGGYVSPAMAQVAKLMGVTLEFVIDKTRMNEPLVQKTRLLGQNAVKFNEIVVPAGTEDSFAHVFAKADAYRKNERGVKHIPISTDGVKVVEDIIGLYANWALASNNHLKPDMIVAACGAGVLTRGLQKGIPASSATQHFVVNFVPTKYSTGKNGIGKATMLEYTGDFHGTVTTDAPIKTTPNVDAKAWNHFFDIVKPHSKTILFWNVAPPVESH